MAFYLKYFGLTQAPFRITPDTEFACATQPHQEALNTLILALDDGEGFVKITGEVGTGKTLLCRRLLQSLGDRWVTAYLPNPNLDPDMLLQAIGEELGIDPSDGVDQYHLLRDINLALIGYAEAQRRVVVCIDEAQAMPIPTLEALRLLSNLETEKRKLVHIVLFGQPELNAHLRRPEVRQLLQRITFHYALRVMRRNETFEYVAHRLRIAGYRGDGVFTRAALVGLHRASGGTPRLINILAHKALMMVYGEGGAQAELRHIRAARSDTEGARRVGWLW